MPRALSRLQSPPLPPVLRSLCFQVPILAAFAASPSATALLMFPTKALAQDQLGALKSLLAAAFGPEAADWVEVRRLSSSCVDPPPKYSLAATDLIKRLQFL